MTSIAQARAERMAKWSCQPLVTKTARDHARASPSEPKAGSRFRGFTRGSHRSSDCSHRCTRREHPGKASRGTCAIRVRMTAGSNVRLAPCRGLGRYNELDDEIRGNAMRKRIGCCLEPAEPERHPSRRAIIRPSLKSWISFCGYRSVRNDQPPIGSRWLPTA